MNQMVIVKNVRPDNRKAESAIIAGIEYVNERIRHTTPEVSVMLKGSITYSQ